MFRFDRKNFTEAYTEAFPKPILTGSGKDGLELLLQCIEQDSEIADVRWAAYMLATVKHECGNTWQPITERGKPEYFTKYDPGTPRGIALGNTQPGDGFLFRGRGYVQITGRTNYGRLSKSLHLAQQMIENPELPLRQDIAYRIMSHGMRNGYFTARKLSQFINAAACDYRNARKIINGLDRADIIEGYAKGLERALTAALEATPGTPVRPRAAAGVTPVEPVPPVPGIAMQPAGAPG